jgi:hypothetical protein
VREFMKKPTGKDGVSLVAVPLADEGFEGQYPALLTFMEQSSWEDGSERETGTMFIFAQGGRWKMMLKDRAYGRIAFYAAETFEELLKVVESSLDEDRVDWKADRKPAGRGR